MWNLTQTEGVKYRGENSKCQDIRAYRIKRDSSNRFINTPKISSNKHQRTKPRQGLKRQHRSHCLPNYEPRAIGSATFGGHKGLLTTDLHQRCTHSHKAALHACHGAIRAQVPASPWHATDARASGTMTWFLGRRCPSPKEPSITAQT